MMIARCMVYFAPFALRCASILSVSMMMSVAMAQSIRPTIYDEDQVPPYTLPHVLDRADGSRVQSATQWNSHREDLVRQLAEGEYGFAPTEPATVQCQLVEEGVYQRSSGQPAQIRRRQFNVVLGREGKQVEIHLIVWSPIDKQPAVPCFVGLNFRGNQSVTDDPAVLLTTSWCDDRHPGVVNHRATEASRASHSERWPIQAIVGRGYAVATAHYSDIDPDFDDGFENGVHSLYPEYRCSDEHPNRWGSIGAWAWGLSRIADALSTIDGIAPDALFVVGHSRLGKTALWAGANDPRFRLVISNNSGCGGAALSKRCYGESVATINRSFPHWFNRNFRKYNDREEQLPFDQHQLIASIAPRPVYIASASKDRWADPLGELLSGHFASPAYELFGKRGLERTTLPDDAASIGDAIGYHLRDGEHDMTAFDWERFMDFAKRHGW